MQHTASSMLPGYTTKKYVNNVYRSILPAYAAMQYIYCKCAAEIGQIRSMKTVWMQYDISIRCIPAYDAIP